MTPQDQIRAWGDQVRAAPASDLALDVRPRSVVWCAMGGSAMPGRALAAARSSVPVFVHDSYGVPDWVGPADLVVCCSYSGSTEESLDALDHAVRAGARGLALTAGQPLASRAREAGWDVVPVPEAAWPRYALAGMTAAGALALASGGLVELPDGWPASTAKLLDNPAGPSLLAGELQDTFCVVWSYDGAAARRWAADLNENAKQPAHWAQLPEACHNEIVAWAPEGAALRAAPGRCVLVCLRSDAETQRERRRFELTVDEVRGSFDQVLHVPCAGDDVLSRFLTAAQTSGLVSIELALRRGVDPGAIEAITRLKNGLG